MSTKRRKPGVLDQLGFLVLPGDGQVPDTFKCSCGGMGRFVEYRQALNHAKSCPLCVSRREGLSTKAARSIAGTKTVLLVLFL